MNNLVIKTWQYIQDPANTFAAHTQSYITLCVVAIALAIVISIPLGVLAAQNAQIAFVATNLSGLFRAIPTIAFFVLALSLLHLGIGFKPAIIALIALGIPPILLNTIAGLKGLDPAITDAARGMGMTTVQVLTRVQLPLVLPVIAAGVRTSAVQIVATAPLAAIIGAGGYGEYIIGGLGLYEAGFPELLAGVIPIVILALAAEFGMAWLQRSLTPRALRRDLPVIPTTITTSKEVVTSSQPAL